jgi:hypothetical protein
MPMPLAHHVHRAHCVHHGYDCKPRLSTARVAELVISRITFLQAFACPLRVSMKIL